MRNKGLAGQQTLVWDAQNRLSQVQDSNGDLLEQYWYDVDGARVKKVSGATTTYSSMVVLGQRDLQSFATAFLTEISATWRLEGQLSMKWYI